MNKNPKALKNFDKFSDANLDIKAQVIVLAMTGNTNFPAPVPAIAMVTTTATDFNVALSIAKTGNRSEMALKNEKRKTLVMLLRTLADYVNFAAQGNYGALVSSGFDVSKAEPPPPLVRPEIVVANGVNSGELDIRFPVVEGARSNMFECTADASLNETSWKGEVVTTARYTFTGLEPGRKYFCRVAVIGSKRQKVYSDVMSRFVI